MINPVQFVREAAKNSPWVVIAVALHAVIIAVMSVIYLASDRDKVSDTKTNVQLAQALPEVVQPEEVIERKAPPKNLEEEIVDHEHDMQYVPTDTPPDYTKEVGNPDESESSGATGGTAIAAGSGPGHFSTGLPSAFSTRRVGKGVGGDRRGPTQSTEKAIREGLLWLIRHQEADGSWNATALPGVCTKNGKCVAEGAKYPAHWQQGLTGVSLLAFLGAGYNFDAKQIIVDTVHAKPHRMGDVIKNGLLWLKKQQQPDGSFGPDQHVYNQAICALALCEAYGLSQNRTWKEPAQKAIDWLVKAQKVNPDGTGTPWGWRYHSRVAVEALKQEKEKRKAEIDAVRAPFEATKADLIEKRKQLEVEREKLKPEEYETQLKELQAQVRDVEAKLKETEPELREVSQMIANMTLETYDSDLSVTTWVVMAFKSAETAGLKVPAEAYEGAKRFVASVSTAEGLAGYQHGSKAGVPVSGPGDQYTYHVGVMSALSMLCRTFIDHDIADPFLEKAAQVIVKDLPEVSKDKLSIDYYYWYYASLALNQFDGPDSPRKGSRYWEQWNRAMQKSLLDTQDDTDKVCSRGGWIVPDRWTLSGGPVYATAMNVLTLEVYYRYPNAFGARLDTGGKKPAKPAKPAEPPAEGSGQNGK